MSKTNLLLLLITLVGIGMLIHQRANHDLVQAEYDRLTESFGTLDVTDPNDYFVRSVNGRDPMLFRWRFYAPGNLSLEDRVMTPTGATMGQTLGGEAGVKLVACRFRFDSGPKMKFFFRDRSGSTTSSFSKNVTGFLKDHWDALEFHVLAQDEVEQIKTDEIVELLQIRVPDSLQAEFDHRIGPNSAVAKRDYVVMKISTGTTAAFSKTGN
jgi:hypothetical protein